jgi:Bacterial TniB protein
VGETNNGKTALVNHFLAQHRAQLGGSGTPSCIPIVAVQAPPLPDERRFYQAILAQVFAPFRPSKMAGNLQFEVVQLLCKRLLRTVLRATSPYTMMEAAWPFIVRFRGATKSTRELTAWPTATGEHMSIR